MIGKSGKSLQQHWDIVGGIGAYKTIAMNDFPNMFYLLGPNSGSGHTSVLFSMEWYVYLGVVSPTSRCRLTLNYSSINLVIEIARPILKREALLVEVSRDAELEWCDTMQSALSKTVLTQSCSNVRLGPTGYFALWIIR